MLRFIFTIAVVTGCIYGAQALYQGVIALTPPAALASAGASPLALAKAPPAAFSATGTLVFYPNNAVPVPYLMFQNASGNAVSKALAFENTPAGLAGWNGARVSVTGYLQAEHVMVTNIAYVSGP